jgi:hypothetical protein
VPKKPTVELPKFVQRIINAGREYFYFLARGSSLPGPRLKLPKGPHDAELARDAFEQGAESAKEAHP